MVCVSPLIHTGDGQIVFAGVSFSDITLSGTPVFVPSTKGVVDVCYQNTLSFSDVVRVDEGGGGGVLDVTPSNLDLSHISCTHCTAPSPGAAICINMSIAENVTIDGLSFDGVPSIYDRYLHIYCNDSIIEENEEIWRDIAYGMPEIDGLFQLSSLDSTQVFQTYTFLPSKTVTSTLTLPPPTPH